MEDKENKKEFVDELKTMNDPIENWPLKKLKKEAEGVSGMGQAQERDEIGIE